MTLQGWQGRKCCMKRDLQSFTVGYYSMLLRSASGTYITFMRQMCNLLKSVNKPGHHIRVNREFRSDLAWWLKFTAEWNRVTIMSMMMCTPPENTITLDASGRWRNGGYWSGRGIPQWRDKPIVQKNCNPRV